MNKDSIKVIEKVIGGSDYLSISLTEDMEVIDYEVNMIKNNISLGYLSVDIRRCDDDKEFLFSLGTKISLSDYLTNENYGISELYDIIESILNSIESSNEFMMDNEKFMYDADYIFLDKDNLMVYMMYVPLNLKDSFDVNLEFKDLCRLILKDAKEYKYDLLNSERKLFNTLYTKSTSLKNISDAFVKYKEEHPKENIINDDQEENSEVSDKENNEFQSIIEEDYHGLAEFDDDELEGDDEDIAFQEFNDLLEYDKQKDNSKTKALLITQIIISVVIGCIGLFFCHDNIKSFILICAAIVILLVLLSYIVTPNEDTDEIMLEFANEEEGEE